ncbi:MAG: DUF4082 domain-containing protein [Acidimicrobiales bacterium]
MAGGSRNFDASSRAGGPKRGISRRVMLKGMAGTAVVSANLAGVADLAGAAGPTNSVAAENSLPGSPPSEWESFRSSNIVGYASGFTFLPGETVPFKIDTASTNYRIRVYRLGWYQGNGARRVADLSPSVPLPQNQPAPIFERATNLVDAGNWAVSASWTIPATAVSGVYYALFERLDAPEDSNHTLFVVRRPGPCDILVQTSDTSWQAYNRWGGTSLYWGDAAHGDSRAYKVSYNRPLVPDEQENDFLNIEYSLVRFLERNGFDVAYCTGLDVHRRASVPANTRVFVSSGHDEYWSGQMRSHVEAARDAGVHLIFMTGNEVFWKIRFEPSVDGAGAADRTLVCYKETLDGAKIDPHPEWTGTWRDPRFSPPSDGGRPENALTGQLFRCINPTSAPDFAIEVPWIYSALRFWRNTAVSALAPGGVTSLISNSLGYEWDQDVDNGHRPAGMIHLSQTTATAQDVLQDFGRSYRPESVTHHMTLYRASSGALVFGAGTVQWAYGLDSYHFTDPSAFIDGTMQQATVNLLADMGVQPATLQSDLLAAAASTDVLAPVSVLGAPLSGAVVPAGVPLTVTGTAVDSGGGTVAAVEVSVDGGATWRMATGTSSWSFVFTPLTLGPLTLRCRAVDDSLNLESPAPGVVIQCSPRALPAPLFASGSTPALPDSGDANPIEVGMKFRTLTDGFITGFRFYKAPANTGVHVGRLWTSAGVVLATATFAGESPSGWQTVAVPPVPVAAGVTYIVSVYMPNGRYSVDAGFFNAPYELWPQRALANGEDGPNGLYRYGSSGFPLSSFGASNYWVDAIFDLDNQAAPTVVDHDPANGVELVARNQSVTATLSEAMNAASLVLELRGPGSQLVAGGSSYDASFRRLTFTPSGALAAHTYYTATVVAAVDRSGDAMDAPYSWTFTTTGDPGTVPTGLWDGSAVPGTIAATETSAVELGVRIRSSVDGQITALRFYKAPGSPGPHVGHLWTEAGVLLGTVQFSNETASGWQQAVLPTPVPIRRNQAYIVSCYNPGGVFPYSTGYFTGTGVTRGPLNVDPSVDGARSGLYVYGPSAMPTSVYLNSNYWVDAVFAIPPDTVGPEVANVVPAPGLLAVAPNDAIAATFNEPIDPAGLSMILRDSLGVNVAGTVTYDAVGFTGRFAPSAPLSPGSVYAASVSARDAVGNVMASPYSWSFTTAVPSGHTPVTLWESAITPAVAAANDNAGLELGVRFAVDRPGVISGIRFYKGVGNSGVHIGHLWRDDGTLLATTTFAAETAVGWQQALFATPIAVAPGAMYVASYYAPVGRYSVDVGYFNAASAGSSPLRAPLSTAETRNGVYAYGNGAFPSNSWNGSNYWVDVIFADNVGPSVSSQIPAPGSVDVLADATVVAGFDEPVTPASISFTLRDGGGATLGGTLAYDGATRRATYTPASALISGASYTAAVSGARDLAGNPMVAPSVWSFTVASAGLNSLWPLSAVPAVASSGDTEPIELGVQFEASTPGVVRGVRFYKGSGNTGVHVGRLWTQDGVLLAVTTFTGESASGWQSMSFPTPVRIQPGQRYVASYFAPRGNYSVSSGYFATDYTAGPLSAPGAVNGLFRYGGGFPTGTWAASNYWVDLVFAAD